MPLNTYQIVLVVFFSLSSVPVSFLIYYCCGWCCFPDLRFVAADQLATTTTTDAATALPHDPSNEPEPGHGDADAAAGPSHATSREAPEPARGEGGNGTMWSPQFAWLPAIEEAEEGSRLGAAGTRKGSMASFARARRDTVGSLFGGGVAGGPRRMSRGDRKEEVDAEEWVWR